MENLINLAPILYFSATDSGVILHVNEFLCRTLLYQQEELVGQKLDRIFTLPSRIFQQTHFFPLLRMQGHAEEIFITLQTKNGDSVPVLINASRSLNGDEAVLAFAGIVVYHRKKFEDELLAAKKAAESALLENTALQQAKETLQQHAEMLDRQISLAGKQHEELRQFSHVVTHELQEPLRKLIMFTNMLLEEDDPAAGKRAAQKIKSVCGQMRTIISGLQQYVWLAEAPPPMAKIDLALLLRQVVETLQSEYPGFVVSIDTEALPPLTADSEQMAFFLREILQNAIRFRKEEEPLEIRVRSQELERNTFRNIAGKYQFASYLKIEIKDNGAGFDMAYKSQVFDLFKRLHPQSGAGLGLSLCKKIAENHGGILDINSREGEGTTVTLFLPVNQPDHLVAGFFHRPYQKIQLDNGN